MSRLVKRPVRTLVALALAATILGGLVSLALIEVWVRWQWDHKRGTPGFSVSDPVRGQRLLPGYDGWFAGVPVQVNALGFRDPREYAVTKPPGTVRILVLGDSVTFGHGAIFETTYPYLLEQRLKAWRTDVRWEVWNLGVPGYNTGQELSHLREVGPRFDPDLVIVGFYPNDFTANEVLEPSWLRHVTSALLRLMQRRLYSYEFYKRAYLTARWKLLTNDGDRRRLEHLADESALLSSAESVADRREQQLSEVEYFDDQQVRDFKCIGVPQVDPNSLGELAAGIRARAPTVAPWLDAVRELQRLGREGVYRLMFFVNMAPQPCPGADRFYNAGALADDDVLLEVLGEGTPVVSSTRAFLHYRPSQVPGAVGHSIGNANRVKADILFDFLRARVLPPLLASTGHTPGS